MSAELASDTDGEHSRRNTVLLLVGVGCAHAFLFLLSYALLTSAPGPRAPDEELVAFYEGGRQRNLVLVGLYVMPFAGIAFLWFCMTLRALIRANAQLDTDLLSGVQLVSGILYVALFFTAAAASSVMAVSIEYSESPLDPMVARQFPQYGATLLLVFAMRMAAMFVFTTARLGRKAEVLPRWFAHVSLMGGLILLFSASFSRVLVLVFPMWLLVLCAVLFVRSRRTPDALAGVARSSSTT